MSLAGHTSLFMGSLTSISREAVEEAEVAAGEEEEDQVVVVVEEERVPVVEEVAEAKAAAAVQEKEGPAAQQAKVVQFQRQRQSQCHRPQSLLPGLTAMTTMTGAV